MHSQYQLIMLYTHSIIHICVGRGAKTHRSSHNAVTRGLVVVQRDGHLAQVKVTPPIHSQQDPEHLVICEEPEEPDELDEEEEEEEEEVEEAGEAQAEEVQETRGRMLGMNSKVTEMSKN